MGIFSSFVIFFFISHFEYTISSLSKIASIALMHDSNIHDSLNRHKYNITVLGCGSWGTAIARRLALNARDRSNEIQKEIKLWVKEEEYQNRSLIDIINFDHINAKYLPNIELPTNIIASSDLFECCHGANILIIAIPHQFISGVIDTLKSFNISDSIILSLSKGIIMKPEGPQLISDMIHENLPGNCVGVLMGANVAMDVAKDEFVEATVACRHPDGPKLARQASKVLASLFSCSSFNVHDFDDISSVEICGALKNVVALGAGMTSAPIEFMFLNEIIA